MKLLIFTSNARRHKYVANRLSVLNKETLVVSEVFTAPNDSSEQPKEIKKHFNLRDEAEKHFFDSADFFMAPTLPLAKGKVNSPDFVNFVQGYNPDLVIIYGSSILKKPLLATFPPNRAINLHLGLSPYYRGSGTNFWPFVNKELEYVGSTLLHIDAGVDTGNIIAHVRPTFEIGDTVHTAGCKVIKDSVLMLEKIIKMVEDGQDLKSVKQWSVKQEKYYKNKDFTEDALKAYYNNIGDKLVEKYLSTKKPSLKLVSLS